MDGNCVTNNSSGQCSISKQSLKANVGSVTFTVIDISSGGSPYNWGANDVTDITVFKPPPP